MDLGILWFVLIGILFTGYFILEGFDFGVGILLPFLGKNDQQRRIIINAIGPHWDGNEVWLITAGGAMFAAFPDWYATLFSGFYLPLLLILVALILRGIAFEFRSKDENLLWRKSWDTAIFVGSLLPAILWGVAFANMVRGVPIDQNLQYTGGFWNLLNIFAILGGLTTLFGFMVHGAMFLGLKTDGDIQQKAELLGKKLWLPFISVLIVYAAVNFFETDILEDRGFTPVVVLILSVVSALAAGWFIRKKKNKQAFALTSASIALFVASLFSQLYPRLMVSSLDLNYSLTIANNASGPATLTAISWIALIFLPFVLAYQGWSYWIFRKRISEKTKKLEY